MICVEPLPPLKLLISHIERLGTQMVDSLTYNSTNVDANDKSRSKLQDGNLG